jgi:hypothetical protein
MVSGQCRNILDDVEGVLRVHEMVDERLRRPGEEHRHLGVALEEFDDPPCMVRLGVVDHHVIELFHRQEAGYVSEEILRELFLHAVDQGRLFGTLYQV